MRAFFTFLSILLAVATIRAQDDTILTGKILNKQEQILLPNVLVFLEGSSTSVKTNQQGEFKIRAPLKGEYVLNISLDEYTTQRIPIVLTDIPLHLNTIYLDKNIRDEQVNNLISLTEAELLEDDINSSSVGLLQATRDVFLTRAAFDFGQAFFRVRGYDSQYSKVLINGLNMNKLFDGRPQWNNWGGLNDATRNQQFTNGLASSNYSFGSLLGTTNIDARPSGLRPGTRLSYSASNRTYAQRLMVTHTSKFLKEGLNYSFSASRRWAEEGYINGTLYDAFSLYAAFGYHLNEKHSFNATAIMASNRRGRSAAITEEVFKLVGNRYNPYWGKQERKIRNSRERKIEEPILMLNHFLKTKKFNLNTGIAYQFGKRLKSRLGYYNAPNPDPTYYRYLPSFYINSTIGANFSSANTAKEGFLNYPQTNWSQIYQANRRAKASYIMYDDTVQDQQLSFSTIANLDINELFKLNLGVSYKSLSSNNYAKINDLLGAEYHEDIDPFSNTLNDIGGSALKTNKAIFGYHYNLAASEVETFAEFKYDFKKWRSSLAFSYTENEYQRNGLFKNERFPNNSLGKGDAIAFKNFGIKGSLSYRLSGRHWLIAHASKFNKAPTLQNVYVNPRENNQIVPHIKSEKLSSLDLNYFIRLPKLIGRFTGFYTRFQDITDVNFFFVESGVGSDFVQEVISDLDKLHKGLELGLEYQLSSSVQLIGVAAIGDYVYANNPSVSINFDTAGAADEIINQEGNIDLGVATLKNYKLAQGPQQAYSLGLTYRDPSYWWLGATANYLAHNYANIATITRTKSFYLNPETKLPFIEATEENVQKLLAQNPLDNFYLLNLVGGKSWLKNGKYISIFVSINNVFDAVFRTGGYEQSRNGNFGELQQDNLSGTPSFAPKYWYGYGRTYFLNMAYSF